MPRPAAHRTHEASWRDGPVRDPRLGSGPTLPVSWADQRWTPPAGSYCGCCRGTRFWTAPGRGWTCSVCHPPSGLNAAALTIHDTNPEPPETEDDA